MTNYYPQTIERTAPKHTPENVAEFFRQGSVALQSRSWDAAGMTFRKALDVSTKELRSDLAKERLVDRIDQMAKDGTVTPELGKWAHEIRISGNDAAHEDQPFSEEEANTLMGFVDLFLTYTFTLPGRLAERRQPPGAVDETS
ncbi:MAG: DUF4145 domain-containing protein [Sphingomonadales bacterium]|nr:DUF4145 domain-containing protein [Sphingomonadales bacterium]